MLLCFLDRHDHYPDVPGDCYSNYGKSVKRTAVAEHRRKGDRKLCTHLTVEYVTARQTVKGILRWTHTELFSGLFHLPFGGCGAGNRLYEGDWSGLGPFLLADRGEPLSVIRGKSKDRDAAL